MSFLGGLAGGLATQGEKNRKGKAKPAGKFKDSPIGKLGSKLKGMLGKKDAVPSYKKGGKVKKTGKAKLHKGEKVIPKRDGKKR